MFATGKQSFRAGYCITGNYHHLRTRFYAGNDTDCYSGANRHADSYTNRNTGTDCHTGSYTNRYSGADRHAGSNSDRNSDTYRHAEADRHTDTYAGNLRSKRCYK